MDRPWLAQDLVWMLGSLCRIYRIPFNPDLVARQYPPPYSEITFIEAATALGFKVGRCDATGLKLSEPTFPLVALLRGPDNAANPGITSTGAGTSDSAALKVTGSGDTSAAAA
ncbi:MAG: hypothetical protein OEV84_10055, partial [Betaproteobacteria bacterium]|nr:hypothetical protein [Betaproteobacteria bacterium]